jgi:hypothetical protein
VYDSLKSETEYGLIGAHRVTVLDDASGFSDYFRRGHKGSTQWWMLESLQEKQQCSGQ